MPPNDRDSIEDLFAYTDWAWNEIANAIESSGADKLLVREASGSGWPALRDCLGHIILAYHRWLGEPVVDLPAFDREAHKTWAAVDEHRAQVRAAFQERFYSFTDEELMLVRDFEIDGETLAYSPGELFTHLLMHERGHHGDVTTLFYQLGVEAEIMLEYRFHVSAQRGYDLTP